MNQAQFSAPDVPVRILIVDDHLGTANTLARAISQLGPGVSVIPATSGKEALERVKHEAADILITDMIMPEMTGLELIEKLQNHPAGRPTFIFLVTAYDVPGLKISASRLHVKEIFTKPVSPERICQTVLQAMEKISQSRPTPKAPGAHKEYKILIADDQPDNLLLLTRYLENEGYSYVQAKDGLEALEKIRSENPDLALLDVNMPHKDGFAALSEIRADPALRHIPVIILTAAKSDSMSVQFGLNLGADDYITKPFDRRELLARIRTKLRATEIETALRQQLAAVLQNTSDPILIFDSKAQLALLNPAAQKLFTDHQPNLGQPLPCGAGYDSLLQVLDKARLAEATCSGEVVWPDQRVFSASVIPVQEGSCVCVLHDVAHLNNPENVKNGSFSTALHDLLTPNLNERVQESH